MNEQERREALKIIGAISTTCAFPFSADELYAQHAHNAGAPAKLPEKPRFFTEHEFRLVTRVADLIIPETDTPGALKTGVPAYIDFVVSRNEEAQKLCRSGLRWLDTESKRRHKQAFTDLAEAQQIALLKPLSDKADAWEDLTALPSAEARERKKQAKRPPMEVAFFKTIKGLTADGYYTSEPGLIHDLGYRGNTVLGEFPTCVHEH